MQQNKILGNCLGSPMEVIELLTSTCGMFIRNKAWFVQQSEKSPLLSYIFATLSRFLADLPSGQERCRAFLIYSVDFILRERFQDLIPMGRELILTIQRLSKIPQFRYWMTLLIHQPQNLCPGFDGGIVQLLSTKSSSFIAPKISYHLETVVKQLMNYKPEIIFTHHCEYFTADYLSGFDSCSLRMELIRYVINSLRFQKYTEEVRKSRIAFLVHLILNAVQRVSFRFSLSVNNGSLEPG
jgi:hypothetical protein